MKILVVSHFESPASPVPIFIRDQINALCALGHEVRAIVPIAVGKKSDTGKRFEEPLTLVESGGVRYCFLRYFSISKWGINGLNAQNAILAIKCRFSQILGDFTPDVIHSHTIGFDSEIGVWLKNKLMCPLVVTTHGSDVNIPIMKGKHELVRRWCNRADVVACVGSRLKEKLLDAGVSTRLVVIHNGFNVGNLAQNVTKHENSLIQVGNLVPSKRVDVTIRALQIIRERCPSAKLTVVGAGVEQEHLKSLCRELKLEDSVEFTGQLLNREVLQKMAESEYFVMVSSPEGFGVVYLEAMASGCLTLGAQNQGIADVIVSGVNGFLLPIDDPEVIAETILQAIDDPAGRMKIVERGRNTALQFSWETNAKQYVTLFESLIEAADENSNGRRTIE